MKKRSILVMVLMIVLVLMTSCKTEDISKRADNEKKVLKALTEYPGNGLYAPEETVIGLGADEPTGEDQGTAEEKAAEEKEAWRNAVGGCFADGMFDTFYSKWYRTHVIGIAWAYGLTTTMLDFGIEDQLPMDSDNIEHALIKVIATDNDGKTQSFDMDWQVIYDEDDHDLLQKIELVDDGGFYDTYVAYADEEGVEEEPIIDETAYEKYGKTVKEKVDYCFDSEKEDLGYKVLTLVRFEKTWEGSDDSGYTLLLFNYEYAIEANDPDDSMLVGGMYLDEEKRLRHRNPYFGQVIIKMHKGEISKEKLLISDEQIYIDGNNPVQLEAIKRSVIEKLNEA